MSIMEWTAIFVFLSPIAAAIAIVVCLVVAECKERKQSRYEDTVMRECIEKKGCDFVNNIITIAKECSLGKDFIMQCLEEAVKH